MAISTPIRLKTQPSRIKPPAQMPVIRAWRNQHRERRAERHARRVDHRADRVEGRAERKSAGFKAGVRNGHFRCGESRARLPGLYLGPDGSPGPSSTKRVAQVPSRAFGSRRFARRRGGPGRSDRRPRRRPSFHPGSASPRVRCATCRPRRPARRTSTTWPVRSDNSTSMEVSAPMDDNGEPSGSTRLPRYAHRCRWQSARVDQLTWTSRSRHSVRGYGWVHHGNGRPVQIVDAPPSRDGGGCFGCP